ncbi:hypothetical protein AHAS_Ahas11G0054800 [Arachis hypogaea]
MDKRNDFYNNKDKKCNKRNTFISILDLWVKLILERTNSKISLRNLEPSSKELSNIQKRNICHSIITDYKAAPNILENDVKNLVSKQIFARWQSILSCFDFTIEHIKGELNSLPDFLTRGFLQEKNGSKTSVQ